MQLVAYALARCAAPDPSGKPDRPPVWLAASSWKDAYAAFFDALGDGRTPEAFRNSLKHARDAFDAHIASGRIGWVDKKAGGKPFRKDAMVSETLATWAHRTDDELRDEVLGLLDGGATEVPEEHSARTEGGQKVYLARRYERDASLRRAAIAHHGRRCMGCRFDFDSTYGASHSRGYIEVHHSIPLADKGVRKTDPVTDLVVLCANCHRMVHRSRDICLSLDELKAKLAAAAALERPRPPALL